MTRWQDDLVAASDLIIDILAAMVMKMSPDFKIRRALPKMSCDRLFSECPVVSKKTLERN